MCGKAADLPVAFLIKLAFKFICIVFNPERVLPFRSTSNNIDFIII